MAINPEALKALQAKLLQRKQAVSSTTPQPMAPGQQMADQRAMQMKQQAQARMQPEQMQGALPQQAAPPADAARNSLMQQLSGIRDSRGPVGEMARGKNMYPGGNAAQQGGGKQFGRPAKTMMAAAKRRMGKAQTNG